MTKAEREAMANQEEQRLHELERARLDKDRLPQTAMDYEELLQTSPNSSAVWIQFISYHLEVRSQLCYYYDIKYYQYL